MLFTFNLAAAIRLQTMILGIIPISRLHSKTVVPTRAKIDPSVVVFADQKRIRYQSWFQQSGEENPKL
jgi:hypothetical protein